MDLIAEADAEQNAEGKPQAGGSSGGGKGEQQQNIPSRRAKGSANTEFAGSLLHGIKEGLTPTLAKPRAARPRATNEKTLSRTAMKRSYAQVNMESISSIEYT